MPSSSQSAARFQIPTRVVDESGNPRVNIFTLQAAGETVELYLVNQLGCGVSVTPNSFVGTLEAAITYDDINWYQVAFISPIVGAVTMFLEYLPGSIQSVSPSIWLINIPPGTLKARVRVNGYVSGTIDVTMNATQAASIPGASVIGGTPFTLQSIGTFDPPSITATQPGQNLMVINGYTFPANIGFVIDYIEFTILGAALIDSTLMGRMVRRRLVDYANAQAAPVAGAVPTNAVFAFENTGFDGVTARFYKYVAVDVMGYEGNYSAASLAVTPTNAQGNRITCPALPAAASGYNIYRSDDGGVNYFLIGRTTVTTFDDLAYTFGTVAGTILPWGTVPNREGPTIPSTGLEYIFEIYRALAVAPTRVAMNGTDGLLVTAPAVAPGVAIGRYRIPGLDWTHGLGVPGVLTAISRDADPTYGRNGKGMIGPQWSTGIVSAISNPTAVGGCWAMWEEEFYGATPVVGSTTTYWDGAAAQNRHASPSEGTVLAVQFQKYPGFLRDDEVVIQLGGGATSPSITVGVKVVGRYF